MDKDILKDAKEDFKRSYDAEETQRRLSQEDIEFAILGKQWPEEVENRRKNEGRPCLTINRLPAFLRQVTNDSRLNRPSIITKPLGEGASVITARIQNDLIRNIWIASQGDVCTDTALDFAAAGGFGYMVVRVDYTCSDGWDQDIMLERVPNPFAIYGDPDSREATSIDWNVAFITDWYSKSKFKAKGWKWEDTRPASFDGDDKEELWYDGDRVRVAEYWKRSEVQTELVKLSDGKIMQADEVEKIAPLLAMEGVSVVGTRPTKTYKVKQYIVTGKDVLEENDWLGRYIPIVPMYGEEWNINGKRHFISLIRRAKDPQQMFNFWRTASTELVALAPLAPWVGAVGAFATDAAKWGTANQKTHAYIEYDPVPNEPPPQRQPFSGVPAGALQEAMNASDDMKSIMGLYDASLGARSNETSGVAIDARKKEGDVSTYNFLDNRNRCIEHVGRVIVDLIPQVYTTERIMRCIQEDGESYNVPLKQPVALKAQLDAIMKGQQAPQPGNDGPPQYVPVTPQMGMQLPPELKQQLDAITMIFDLTVGKYDVTVEAGPSFTTRREETSAQMMEFIRVFPQAAPLIGDLLAKNLDWPGAEQVSDRLKAMLPPQAQGQIAGVVQQLQQQLQQQGQQMQQMDTALKDKNEETRIKKFEADTKRIQALADAHQKGLMVTVQADGSITGVPLVPTGMGMPMNGQPVGQQPMQTPPQGGVSAFGQQNTPEQPPGM